MFCTEIYIMRDHEDGHAAGTQLCENTCKFGLEKGVHPLCGFIQKQDVRPAEQKFCQGGPLLFAARKVEGMPA